MEDIIMRIARMAEPMNLPKDVGAFDRYVRAMDAANECVDAECRTTAKQLSEKEQEAAREKYFRIEASKLEMPAKEIEGRLYVHAETGRIIKEVWDAEVCSGSCRST